jgi:hypothetical protein
LDIGLFSCADAKHAVPKNRHNATTIALNFFIAADLLGGDPNQIYFER